MCPSHIRILCVQTIPEVLGSFTPNRLLGETRRPELPKRRPDSWSGGTGSYPCPKHRPTFLGLGVWHLVESVSIDGKHNVNFYA
jgi:hypothetical protein